jgi:NAD(P)-dependent dehydrogenase (short-subunit alcohol dehydrogenase family)
MTSFTPQEPIGSGFGARSTAAEVVDGIDLTGRLAVVTGGYSGLGLETVKALAGAGAHVVVPARRPAAATEALAGAGVAADIDALDLGDLDSVRAFAQRFLDSGRAIDILINNAAIMASPETRVGPGWEAQFAVNHVGHFALVCRLWPALRRAPAARVVAVASGRSSEDRIRWDDVHFARNETARPAPAQVTVLVLALCVMVAAWVASLPCTSAPPLSGGIAVAATAASLPAP